MRVAVWFVLTVVCLMVAANESKAAESWEVLADTPVLGGISDVVVDNDGVVWVSSTSEGVFRYDGEFWQTLNSDTGFFSDSAAGMALGPDGSLWVNTLHGLCHFDGETWELHEYPKNAIAGADHMAVDGSGTVWCGNTGALAGFDSEEWTVQGMEHGLPNDFFLFRALVIGPDGHPYISIRFSPQDSGSLIDAVFFFNGEEWRKVKGPEPDGSYEDTIINLLVTPDGDFWADTGNDLYDMTGGAWELLVHDITRFMYTHDSFGTLWAICTINLYQYGTCRFDGEKWRIYSAADGLPGGSITNLTPGKNGEMWAVTDNRLARYTPEIVAVEKEKPSAFFLTGNYPNPFNPVTRIEYSLNKSGFTKLTIYTITGQKIRSLLSSFVNAGRHSVVWDGCADGGFTMSSGVYISRLKMGDMVATGRMLFMK